jgi:hypothetical protein
MRTLKARLTIRSELTFIILARTSDRELATTDIPTLPMVGDVNIFLNGTPGDQDFESEAEIMIAGELTPSEYLRSPPITQPFFRCSPHQSSLELSFFPQNQPIAEKVSQLALYN